MNQDVSTTRTLLHESVPITGTLVSGTYMTDDGAGTVTEHNIKNYSHGMFQSVYDYPYLSSSANHIFDLTVGYSSNSAMSASESTRTQQQKKINIYNQMAKLLVGVDVTGNVKNFGDHIGTADSANDLFFMSFSRLLTKDEVQKGSFTMTVVTGGNYNHGFDGAGELTIDDSGSVNNYRTDSPAGEFGILYASPFDSDASDYTHKVGAIYYQAGIIALTASIFNAADSAGGNDIEGTPAYFGSHYDGTGNDTATSITASLQSIAISGTCNGLRNRMKNLTFNNTTELNSTIYFCRANNNEFNYSSNPTYVENSKLRVKSEATDSPVSYITTVGLYSADNELLAVAKLSEPLRKDPTNEITLRCRLDY